MIRLPWWLASLGLGLLLGSRAPAQHVPSEAEENQEQETPAEKRFRELEQEVRAAQNRHVAEYRKKVAAARAARKAAEAEGRAVQMALPMFVQYDRKPHIPAYWAAAQDFAGTADAVRFLDWIVLFGARTAREESKKAVDLLLQKHIERPQLELFASQLHWVAERAEPKFALAPIATLIEKSPHGTVRGAALFSRGMIEMAAAKKLEGEAKKAAIESALETFDAALDLSYESSWSPTAEGVVREWRLLQPGMIAPNIVGEDLNGVSFGLHDYRGKAVMLAFWGDW